mgnify:CR=1 FL=1
MEAGQSERLLRLPEVRAPTGRQGVEDADEGDRPPVVAAHAVLQ